jgi:hypothetical protein
MSPSRLPEQIDLKDAAFCTPCAEHIEVPSGGLLPILKTRGEKK